MEIYDTICREYKKALASEKRKYTLEHTFFACLGDVSRKRVLDLACGEGYYSRMIRQHGAGTVVGVDISASMINAAKAAETEFSLGISYKQYEASKLPVLDEFDIVTAAFLLHYSKTRKELFSICRNIYANLKQGGIFVSLNLNPDNPFQPDNKYDSTITYTGDLKEGCVINVTLYANDKPLCSFYNYHWEKKTYEDALRSAGFKDVRWRDITVSAKGYEKYGAGFWENYLKQPGVSVIEAR